MANWQRQINIEKEWEKAENKEITVKQLADIIINKLENLEDFDDGRINNEKQEIIQMFDIIGEDEKDDFNDAMTALYDWGDIKLDNLFPAKKVCFVRG